VNTALKIVVPVGILALGVFAAVGLSKLRPKAHREAPAAVAPAVDVYTVTLADLPVVIEAPGVVSASRQVLMGAEVAGRVRWRATSLVPGGRLKKGDALLRVDDRDHQIAVAQAEAAVKQAELELRLEQSRGLVAKRDWEALGDKKQGRDLSLALREPQLQNALAQVESVRQGLRRAELSLERSTIVAPFDALVLDVRAEVGQYLMPGTGTATLVATDEAWVNALVRVDDLRQLNLEDPAGTAAEVVQTLADGSLVSRVGTVLRLGGSLDAETRTALVTIAVPRPFETAAGALPLLLGAPVSVRITGEVIPGAARVPRSALVGGEAVWVVDRDARLERRKARVAWSEREHIVLQGVLRDGDQVLVTPLSMPLPGALVRVRADLAANAANAATIPTTPTPTPNANANANLEAAQ
jgi:RND family efflux transporter MFP subunit